MLYSVLLIQVAYAKHIVKVFFPISRQFLIFFLEKRQSNELDADDQSIIQKEDAIEEEFCFRLFEFARAGAKCFGMNLLEPLQREGINKLISLIVSSLVCFLCV